MEAQGLAEGNLRNSHRETHALRRKPAPAKLQQRAYALVESCSQDLILRQRLDVEKTEGLLKRSTFYVLESTGRGSPGFLVFLPGQPAVFLQLRKGKGPIASTLRMRVSATLGEGGGSILIATLDDVLHSLRLEDVWMWRGESICGSKPYSARRAFLKEFVEHHWVPDARLLGGIFTSVANPMSLEAFTKKTRWDDVASVEFIPEMAGKRRLVVMMEEIAKAATGHAAEKKFREPATASAAAPAAVATTPVQSGKPDCLERVARAVAVDKMPDVYDLFDEAGLPISRASVQQFALSQTLKAQKGEIWVNARWRSEFGGYEITGLSKSQPSKQRNGHA